MTPAPSAYRESVRLLPCEGERLLAVLCEPNGPASGDLGLVIVVGGPQYRAGSHRHFVHLARTLAGAGICTLRFDMRGMGDSTGAQRSFEHLTADTGAAIDALLAARTSLRRVALWGLCDGASAALLYMQERADARVTGLCLLNPWVRSDASLARTHVKHYYRQRLAQREFWLKLASGRVAGAALRSLWDNLKAARARPGADRGAGQAGHAAATDYQTRMAQAWQSFGGPLMLVLSGQDYTAREFTEFIGTSPAWSGALAKGNMQRHDMAQADHTFSDLAQSAALEAATAAWLATAC
jgi:exosortase A-associated hydrolase 1